MFWAVVDIFLLTIMEAHVDQTNFHDFHTLPYTTIQNCDKRLPILCTSGRNGREASQESTIDFVESACVKHRRDRAKESQQNASLNRRAQKRILRASRSAATSK